jgi:peptidoglycan-N-acetylglucosamine deacetylase
MRRITKRFRTMVSYLNPYIKYNGRRDKNAIALTFDDGPDEKQSNRILELLDRYKVKATFFVVGSFALRHRETIRLMAQNGHEIANHSFSHDRDNYSNAEIIRANETIQNITGACPVLYRPPWAKITANQLLYVIARRMRIVLWSVDSYDHKANSSAELIQEFKSAEISSGDIILLHENRKATVEALPKIIETIKKHGFEFSLVSDIMP